jgi:hypothetical protein
VALGDMLMFDVPMVLDRLAFQLLWGLTAQAGTAPKSRNKENSDKEILRVLFM